MTLDLEDFKKLMDTDAQRNLREANSELDELKEANKRLEEMLSDREQTIHSLEDNLRVMMNRCKVLLGKPTDGVVCQMCGLHFECMEASNG